MQAGERSGRYVVVAGSTVNYTIYVDETGSASTCGGTITISGDAFYQDRAGRVHHRRQAPRQVERSQAWAVARKMAIEGVLYCLSMAAQDCQWLQVLMLLYELVRLTMMGGRWLSASQGVDGKQLVVGFLGLLGEAVS